MNRSIRARRRGPQPADIAPVRNSAIDMNERISSEPRRASTHRGARECQLKMYDATSVSTTIWLIQPGNFRLTGGGPRRWLLQTALFLRPGLDRRFARHHPGRTAEDQQREVCIRHPETLESRLPSIGLPKDSIAHAERTGPASPHPARDHQRNVVRRRRAAGELVDALVDRLDDGLRRIAAQFRQRRR